MSDIHDYESAGDDLATLAEDAFAEATESHVAEEDNRDSIHSTFEELIDAAIGSGQMVVTGQQVRRLAKDWLWMQVNQKASRRTLKVLKSLAQGNVPLSGIDTALDYVITAGKARRTTLRHLATTDLVRIDSERRENLDKQSAAYEDLQSWLPQYQEWLIEYGTIEAAIDAGAILLASDDAAGVA